MLQLIWLIELARSSDVFGTCNFFEAESGTCKLSNAVACLYQRSLLTVKSCQRSRPPGTKHLPMDTFLWRNSPGNSHLRFGKMEQILLLPDCVAFKIKSSEKLFPPSLPSPPPRSYSFASITLCRPNLTWHCPQSMP